MTPTQPDAFPISKQKILASGLGLRASAHRRSGNLLYFRTDFFSINTEQPQGGKSEWLRLFTNIVAVFSVPAHPCHVGRRVQLAVPEPPQRRGGRYPGERQQQLSPQHPRQPFPTHPYSCLHSNNDIISDIFNMRVLIKLPNSWQQTRSVIFLIQYRCICIERCGKHDRESFEKPYIKICDQNSVA